MNKKINLSHCSALIISEDLAKDGVREYFNTLSNNTELRHNCQMVVSSSTSYDVLEKISNSGEDVPSRLFDHLSTSSDYTGFTLKSTFQTVFQAFHNNSFEPVTIYTITTDDSVQTAGIGVFKDEFFVGNLDVMNSIAHLILTNQLESSVITIASPFKADEHVDLAIELFKDTKISIDIVNGSPYISIVAYPEATVRSSGKAFNYINQKNIRELEQSVSDYLQNLLEDYLYKISKEFKSDVVGFEGLYKSKFLTKEKFDEVHWDEIFEDSFFNVKVNTRVDSSSLFNKE